MNKFIVLMAALLLSTGCSRTEPSVEPHTAVPTEAVKGPHGGRLLQDGAFSVELAIFEDGVSPEHHAWISQAGKAVPLDQVELRVELTRLDGEQNTFKFQPQGDYLRGDGVVEEPHSFIVAVAAKYNGAAHQWQYDSFEGRVTIPTKSAHASGIQMAKAGSQLIRDVVPLYGRVVLNPEAVREVSARFPGSVKTVAVSLGQAVKAGAVLAQVESSDSLQVYAVTAPISGVITERRTNPGQQADTESLFVISDLSQSWVELSVFPRDMSRLRVGQQVRLKAVDGDWRGDAEIVRIAPAGISANQSLKAWARIKQGGVLTPGQYVNADVLVGGAEVPLAVRADALQTFREFTVVFIRVGETYEVRMLELGRNDGEHVEVLSGLKPGTEYVAVNSYLIKADIEKSGASHDH